MIKSYRELEVYKRAFALSLDIHRISQKFPKEELYALSSQIKRSSKSICANIAEGFAKQKASKAEFKRFLMMAFGSCTETLVWLDYCIELEYVSREQYETFIEGYEHVSKMLLKLHANIKPFQSS